MTRETSSTRLPSRRSLRVPALLAGHAGRTCGRPSRWSLASLVSRSSATKRQETFIPGMSEVVRLTLVSHAMTDAMSAGRFPPTNRSTRSGTARSTPPSNWASPTVLLRAGEALQADRRTAWPAGRHRPRLADLDCGRWRGDVLGGVRPADLAVWLTDPPGRRTAANPSSTGRPGRALDGNADHPSRPAGRRHTPVGHPRRDPGGARRTAEIVLAHRHCSGQPDRDAFPRHAGRCAPRVGQRRRQIEGLGHDRQQPAAAV